MSTPLWELHLRKIRRAFFAHCHPDTKCQLVLISQDLADQIVAGRPEDMPADLEDSTFETIPIKVDKTLPEMTAVYIPVGENLWRS